MPTLRSEAAVDRLETQDLEAAAANLEWPSRTVQSMVGGSSHAEFKERGFPTSMGNSHFLDRNDYLKHRLKNYIRRGGVVSFESVKAAAKKVAGKGQSNVEVKKTVKVELNITENKTSVPHTFEINPNTERVTCRRTQNSKGQNVCTESRSWDKEGFTEALRLITTDTFKNAPDMEVKSSQVKVAGGSPTVTVQGRYPLVWSRVNAHSVQAQTSGYTFTFNDYDIEALYAVMTEDYSSIEEPEATPAAS
jgi:hypothetical protein